MPTDGLEGLNIPFIHVSIAQKEEPHLYFIILTIFQRMKIAKFFLAINKLQFAIMPQSGNP